MHIKTTLKRRHLRNPKTQFNTFSFITKVATFFGTAWIESQSTTRKQSLWWMAFTTNHTSDAPVHLIIVSMKILTQSIGMKNEFLVKS